MFPRLVVTIAVLSSLALPAAAGMRDTPLCKQELATTLASLNESSTRVQRVGTNKSEKSEEACFAYRTYFLSIVKARTMTAQCKIGPERDQDLGKLDAGVEQANNGIAARCS